MNGKSSGQVSCWGDSTVLACLRRAVALQSTLPQADHPFARSLAKYF